MSVPGRWAELRERIRRDGLVSVGRQVVEVLRDRILPPWEEVYWMRAREVNVIDSDLAPELRVVTSLDRLRTHERQDLERSLGASALPLVESRLAAGCELHVLVVGDKVAGSRFVVFGRDHPFQNVVLAEDDCMGLDVRIDPGFRGQGLAPVFFSLSIQDLAKRGVDRVFATVSVRNVRSRKTLLRVGFRHLLNLHLTRGHYRYDRDVVR